MDRSEPTGREDGVAVRAEHGPAQRRVDHAGLQVAHGAQSAVRARAHRVGRGARSGARTTRPCQLLGHLGHAADRVEALAGHVGVG